MASLPKQLSIDVGKSGKVSGLLIRPAKSIFGYVLAHGAGAGMNHPFMAAVAEALAERNVATLRYQFPYMEAGGKRPDTPAVAQATIRAAVAAMRQNVPGLKLIAGGKSFGGRMTSQAQAAEPLEGVSGLAFLGFPLHPANKPSTTRAEHLKDIKIPMLFLQGTRDALADQKELSPVIKALRKRATLFLVPDADHSFHVPARSGKTDKEVLENMMDELANWGQVLT
ncbi:MAG: alpha/beta family hydrolase [Hyphomicrobiales bacterium]